MAQAQLSRVALADFDAILDHLIDVAGNRVAVAYSEQLQASINRVAGFPGIGTPRSELGSETRMLSVDPYLIFYDGGPKSETIQILRILHGHRNITPELITRGRKP